MRVRFSWNNKILQEVKNFQNWKMTIPQMNKQLDDLDRFFTTRTTQFTQKIQSHEGKFTFQDRQQFFALLHSIKEDALNKITLFFESKFSIRSQSYQTQIQSFELDGENVKNEAKQFRENLVKKTMQMKEQQNRKELLMEHFSEKFRRNLIMKKCLKLLRNYEIEKKRARALDKKMNKIYERNLMKKSFFPWRTLMYKDGYANSVRRQTQKDIIIIHEQYQNIISILKTKICETDQIIRVKKASKGQFAYALSKNMLKTISNLSLQVMNLNQMSLRDGQWVQEQTHNIIKNVDKVVQEKLDKVREYRRGLLGEAQIGEDQIIQKKKKHISFA